MFSASFALLVPCLAPADDLAQLEQKAFRAAVDRVAPSVVRIETVGGLERVGRVLFGTGPTTGVMVAPDGYIVSSAFNFVHKPASILVQLPGGTRKAAKLVATDHNRMIALLNIDVDKPLPVPEAAPEREFRVGQWTIAVGRTFEGNQPNLATGVVSAVGRVWGKAVQTDAAVSPNNYGGPLVDLRGRVMGILVPMSPQDTSDMAGYEWYDSGIGFAVPFEKVLELLPRLKQGKDLQPGVIGIAFSSQALFMAEPVLANCRPKSPAHEAGLRKGDRVVEIEGQKIEFASHIKRELSRRYAGDKIKLAVVRDGKRIEKEVELAAKLPPYQHPFLGVLPMRPVKEKTVAETGKPTAKPETKPAGKPDPKTAEAAKTPPEKAKPKPAGVTVRWVYPDSPAAKAGIQAGDLLATLAGQPIQDAADLTSKLADHQPDETVALELTRGGQSRKVELKLASLPETAPPDGIPPAHKPGKPAQGKGPTVGTVQLKSGEFPNEAWAYAPEGYDPAVSHGLVIWLHGPGGLKEKDLIARWKPLCDRYDLVLLAPKAADAARWQSRELAFVRNVLSQVVMTYNIDPSRIVAGGEESGGSLAFTLAAAGRNVVHGVVVVNAAAASGRVSENEPQYRQAFYIARSERSRSPAAVRETIKRLREQKFPVTVKDLGRDPRPLTAQELAELARWIDALDRL